ncbi:hypothetical protein ES703_116235 [subsurface metagenome]
MAKADIASVFGEILPDIEVSSPVRLISLYSGVSVELPEVLEEQSADIAHATYQAVVVNDLTLLKLGNSEVKGSWHPSSSTRQPKTCHPSVVVLIPELRRHKITGKSLGNIPFPLRSAQKLPKFVPSVSG